MKQSDMVTQVLSVILIALGLAHADLQSVAVNQDTLGNYDLNYAVHGISRSESRDAFGNVNGGFAYIDPRGNLRQTEFTSGVHGFHAFGPDIPTPVHDTPEVALAKAQHLSVLNAAYAEAATRPRNIFGEHTHYGSELEGPLFGGGHGIGPLEHPIPTPLPPHIPRILHEPAPHHVPAPIPLLKSVHAFDIPHTPLPRLHREPLIHSIPGPVAIPDIPLVKAVGIPTLPLPTLHHETLLHHAPAPLAVLETPLVRNVHTFGIPHALPVPLLHGFPGPLPSPQIPLVRSVHSFAIPHVLPTPKIVSPAPLVHGFSGPLAIPQIPVMRGVHSLGIPQVLANPEVLAPGPLLHGLSGPLAVPEIPLVKALPPAVATSFRTEFLAGPKIPLLHESHLIGEGGPVLPLPGINLPGHAGFPYA